MVFEFEKGTGNSPHIEISATELDARVRSGKALVVDVRERDEFAAGHIPGAINMPLSSFQPSGLPDAKGKTVVLNCLGGKRSGMALDKCSAALAAVDTHLAGGFGAWQSAGLPVER
ncbi:rhodanese-like domain-containing protein [Novosphingobium sp. SL115]|uniref:rhodanese-like domain-containing protein n=1 Tax=Novosphingobium sp. SL115 TaxID=2995150 RepID=UPI002273A122|nr:rhodanese-like domain-containing protein [Novosphingobium sp. SL115]MCY1670472.1 rhodanese-like domain-containing protein [Novosphingobium sp. SL115]